METPLTWDKASFLEKREVHRKYGKALRDGVLIRPNHCEECGKECKPDGHHDDYNKPFEVVWLCGSCHRRKHPRDHSKFVYDWYNRNMTLTVRENTARVAFAKKLSSYFPVDTILKVSLSHSGKTITLSNSTEGCKVKAANRSGSKCINMTRLWKELVSRKIPLPAKYWVDMDEKTQEWVGRLKG
jgi:hypothetical protein